MESFACNTNTFSFCSSNLIRKTKDSPTKLCQIRPRPNLSSASWGLKAPASRLLQQREHDQKRPAVIVGCGGSSSGPEKELEAELRPEEVAAWLIDECREGGGGPVELLECLEREAIMGEDEGKEPNDYNRRAQIFYRSSRVFQALKERTSHV